VSVALKKVNGVESVDVSLEKGEADMKLQPGNQVRIEKVRDIIRANGFTPKDAEATIAGRLTERNGKPALAVSGSDLVYLLADSPSTKGKTDELFKSAKDKNVVVTGRAPETAKNPQGPFTLQVESFKVE